MSYSRTASLAGPNGAGWYEAIPDKLDKLIRAYFNAVDAANVTSHVSAGQRLVGLIAPHAGMSYSGRTASEAYNVLRHYLYATDTPGTGVSRIFILGPSHRKAFTGVEISDASVFETPFGPLTVDREAVNRVRAQLQKVHVPVALTSRRTDQDEHSLEMQTPFLSHVLHYPPASASGAAPAVGRVALVPMIVGSVDDEMEESMTKAMLPYLNDAANVFVFSSDFCHWGSRFRYTYHYQKPLYPVIGDAIVAMDHEAMDILHRRSLTEWRQYLETTGNTICGRHPISVGVHWWSNLVARPAAVAVDFVHYSQSSKCTSLSDSSVSYASAVITQKMNAS